MVDAEALEEGDDEGEFGEDDGVSVDDELCVMPREGSNVRSGR